MTTINAIYDSQTGEMATVEIHVNHVTVRFEARQRSGGIILVPIEIETQDLDGSYDPLKAYASPFEIASALRTAASIEGVDCVKRFDRVGLDGDSDE